MNYQDLYTKHYKNVYYICLKFLKNPHDAEDMTQNVFMKAFDKIETLENIDNFKSWISQIANRACLDELKHKGILQISSMEDEDSYKELPDYVQKNPEDVALDNEVKDIMLELINKLPEDQRIAIYLYYYQEMSVKEISKVFNCPEQSTRNRLGYARKNIRKYVDEMEDNGIKLRCIAILPFLYVLFNAEMKEVCAMTVTPEYVGTVSSTTLSGSTQNVIKGENRTMAKNIGNEVEKSAGKGIAKSLGMKLGITAIGVALVASVSIGIATIGNSSNSNRANNDTTESHDRESLMNNNDDVEIVGYNKDKEGNYIYYGIDGKGKLLEYKTNYEVFHSFYKGYAVGRIASNNYQLVDKDFNVIFEATRMKNGSDHKDYITYKDKETSLWGCMYYNGKKVVEPKYDDIEVVYCEDSEYKTEMIIGYIDERADYYDANGKLIFNGNDSYDDYNFKAHGFGLIGNNNSKDSVLYSYSTGKKLDQFTYAYKGPVLDDSENKKYILHNENFDVIKEYPYENGGKKYTDVFYSNSTIWFTYNNDNKEYFSDLYSAKTGEFLFTIPSSDINAVCDKDNNEYYVYNTEKNDKKTLNIMNHKGNIVFTDNSGMEFVLSSGYVLVTKNDDNNYLVYSMGDFKLISDIEYDTYEISGDNHIYIQEDTKECLFINSYGVEYKFNVPIETDEWIYVDAFLLYDYLLMRDKDLNKYIVDATTGKITYDMDVELDADENVYIPYKCGEIAPYVERNGVCYDYLGNVIVDCNTYGK